LNTQRWALGGLQELVFDPEQDKEVPCNVTREALGRGQATRAQKTCVQVAAAALAEAGGNADVFAAARKLHDAALDLQDADRITKRDAHSAFRAAAASYQASLASAEAVGDDAAVAVAQKLVEASEAFDVAAKAVVDAVDSDAKLAARRDLEAAEEAFKTLYEPLKTLYEPLECARERARRPRPTSRAVRRRPISRRRVAGAVDERGAAGVHAVHRLRGRVHVG
jgi:hypothetical protein